MFENQKFLTRGVMAEIPSWLTNLMWHMVLTMEVEEKDYLQVFRLTRSCGMQEIEHTQEQPGYKRVICVPAADAIDAKVYIIEDPEHATMLLAEEY